MRLLGLSEDRKHLLLTGPETGTVMLPVDDRVRAAVLGDRDKMQTLRTGKVESALSPREIQARLRAGEPAEDVATAAGVPVSHVRRFEGPVRDERVHAVDGARAAIERGADPLPLGERVDERLAREGADPASVEWDSWRADDGVWIVQLRYRAGALAHTARWHWDATRRVLTTADETAEQLGGPNTEREIEEALTVTAGAKDAPPPPLPVSLTLVPEPDELPVVDTRTGKTDRRAEEDGVAPGKRATVPSWDEILLGTRPPEN
jgi:hypothetical protein